MTGGLPAVRHRIVVPVPAADAFRIFTEEIGTWWPMDDQRSVHGPGGTVSLRDRLLVETATDGRESVWAQVLEGAELLAHPPDTEEATRRPVDADLDHGPRPAWLLAWHPGHEPESATQVEVRFDEVDSATGDVATLVTLEHTGWERLADAARSRLEYEAGWPTVLGEFGAATAAAAELIALPEQVWLVVRHSVAPAPSAAGAAAVLGHGPVFAHPDFAEHVGFLNRMADRGVLIAAGPLQAGDQPGAEAMTVLRVDADEADDYERRCRENDLSVVRGLFDVQITRWNVVTTGAQVS